MNKNEDFDKLRLERLKKVREQNKTRANQVLNTLREFDNKNDEILKEKRFIRAKAIESIREIDSEMVSSIAVSRMKNLSEIQNDSLKLAHLKQLESDKLMASESRHEKARVAEAVRSLRKQQIDRKEIIDLRSKYQDSAKQYSEMVREKVHEEKVIKERALRTLHTLEAQLNTTNNSAILESINNNIAFT